MAMGNAGAAADGLVAGRYRLQDVVHREVNCVCWYAEDIEYARPRLVTQTQLPADEGAESARRTVARILRVSDSVGLLRPAGVATVIDVVEEAGAVWTVVEWIDGMPLGELLDQQGAFHHVRAARIGLDILDVLEAAHGEGVVHGELSLGQVFVRDQGGVVLTGFGLAGAVPPVRLGAPLYAAPEQARGGPGGPAADLWALGALLYTMTEGRPPFRDRGRPEATFKAIERLPLRTPVKAGPLARTVQGLLRKSPGERITAPVVREALARVVSDDQEGVQHTVTTSRLSLGHLVGGDRGSRRWGRLALVGAAVVAVAVTVTALATAGDGAPEDSSAGRASASRTPADADGPSVPPIRSSEPAAPSPSGSPSASPPPSAPGGLPDGFRVYDAPEGFSVALPDGWEPVSTRREDRAYRVVFGTEDDPRSLAVTYSASAGADPVAVWRDDVEPGLQRRSGYDRLGGITATTYQGYEAADMEWLVDTQGTRVRTFGRGFLLGGGRSFSLRWTTPAEDWTGAGNQRVLRTVLDTFRPSYS
ncbi:serine/threonine-protein kinase [Streptomyces fructofermentans]|uniref:serine/threonine-protein kinase n=1 Tax=Streptomyces fructofermentans TaxID=152141 RepID=UPI0033E9C0D2